MLRYLRNVGLAGSALLLLAAPASAASHKQKLETCRIGAKSEHLTGKKETDFVRKCMGRGDYEPAARKAMMKHEKTMKKPAKKKAAMKKTVAKKKAEAMKPAPKQQ